MQNIKNIRRMGGLQSNQRLNANSYSSKRSEGGARLVLAAFAAEIYNKLINIPFKREGGGVIV